MKGRSKNVRIFGGAPENDEIINGKVGDQELRQQRHWIFCKCVMVISKSTEHLNIAP